jgi:hypothetical protein
VGESTFGFGLVLERAGVKYAFKLLPILYLFALICTHMTWLMGLGVVFPPPLSFILKKSL